VLVAVVFEPTVAAGQGFRLLLIGAGRVEYVMVVDFVYLAEVRFPGFANEDRIWFGS
jgi:hypothetical protein